MKREHRLLYKKLIQKLGEMHQIEKCVEELNELCIVLDSDEIDSFALIDEVADVEITMEQLKVIFPYLGKEVRERKKFKIERLKREVLGLLSDK